MMFKKEMANLIFAGLKTQTRRVPSKKIYKVGSIQPIQINYFDKAKGHIKITRTYEQKLGDMNLAEVRAEGFDTWLNYMTYLNQINPKKAVSKDLIVKVYEFKLLKSGICSFPETTSCPECESQKICADGLKHPCDVEFNDP